MFGTSVAGWRSPRFCSCHFPTRPRVLVCPVASIPRLAVGLAGSCGSGADVGSLALLQRGHPCCSARHHNDGHPRVVGHCFRDELVDLRDVLARQRSCPTTASLCARSPIEWGHLSRCRCRCHHPSPCWALLRGTLPAAGGERPAVAHRDWRQRCDVARRKGRRVPHTGVTTHHRGRVRRTSRRDGRHGRRRCSWTLRDRPCRDDGRIGPLRRQPGIPGLGGDHLCGRANRCQSDKGGPRHPTGPNDPTRRKRPERKGGGAADRRPHFKHLRSRGSRRCLCDAPRLVAGRSAARTGVQRRTVGAHHRVPLCARLGNAHRSDRGLRTWGTPRDLFQGL